MTMDAARITTLLADEPLPAVLVDLDAFDRNLAQMARIASDAGKTLRVATKSIRVPALIERVLAHGSPCVGVMCFAAGEAKLLYERGVDDLLIAYPTVQSSDLALLRGLVESGATVRLMIDDVRHMQAVETAFAGCSTPLDLLVDIDMSLRLAGGRVHLGVRRSRVRDEDDLRQLLEASHAFQHSRIVGAMGYEAQVAGLGDRNPFKRLMNPVFRAVRALSMRQIVPRRAMVARVFDDAGVPLTVFNGGGTGSLNLAADEPALTELTAGSGLLCPHLFDYYRNIRFEPACWFALQAVRSSDPGIVTLQGGGYVASGEPGWDKVPAPAFGGSLVSAEGTGEVQTPLKLEPGMSVELGEPVALRHAKAGELAERFTEYLLVSDGQIVDRAATYRGLGACFF